MKLEEIALSTANLNKTAKFYEYLLGTKAISVDSEKVEFILDDIKLLIHANHQDSSNDTVTIHQLVSIFANIVATLTSGKRKARC